MPLKVLNYRGNTVTPWVQWTGVCTGAIPADVADRSLDSDYGILDYLAIFGFDDMDCYQYGLV